MVNGQRVVNHDHINRSRLRFDARRWYASRLAPKKYGERLTHEISGPDGRPLEVMTENQLAMRLEAIFDAAARRKAIAEESGEDLV
jgi:hypothetical protein